MKKLIVVAATCAVTLFLAGSVNAKTTLSPLPGFYSNAVCVEAKSDNDDVTSIMLMKDGKVVNAPCIMLNTKGEFKIKVIGLDKDGDALNDEGSEGEYVITGVKMTDETFQSITTYKKFVRPCKPAKKAVPKVVKPATRPALAKPAEVIDITARLGLTKLQGDFGAMAKKPAVDKVARKMAKRALKAANRPRGPQLRYVPTGEHGVAMAAIPRVACVEWVTDPSTGKTSCKSYNTIYMLPATVGEVRELRQEVVAQGKRSPFSLAPELGYLYSRAGGASDKLATTVANLSWQSGNAFSAFLGLGGAWRPDAEPSLLFQGGVEVWGEWIGLRAQIQLALLDITGTSNGELVAFSAGPVFRYKAIYGGLLLGGGTRFLPNGADAAAFVVNLFAGYRF